MLQGYGLPYNCKIGQPVNALIGLLGDPLKDLKFEVSMDYGQVVSTDPLRFSEPVVERAPLGILRIGIRVSGRRIDGGEPYQCRRACSRGPRVRPVDGGCSAYGSCQARPLLPHRRSDIAGQDRKHRGSRRYCQVRVYQKLQYRPSQYGSRKNDPSS